LIVSVSALPAVGAIMPQISTGHLPPFPRADFSKRLLSLLIMV